MMLKKLTATVGVFAIAVIGALIYRDFNPSMKAQIATVVSLPREQSVAPLSGTEESHLPSTSRSAASDNTAVPSAHELRSFNTWMKARGYPFDVMNGGKDGNSSDSGFVALDEQTLRGMAMHDQLAAFILAKKLLEKSQGILPTTKAQHDEIVNLLEDASIRGYTSSLDLLVELMRAKALKAGSTRTSSQMFNREALVEAYAYAYLQQKRGDINSEMSIQTLRDTSPLSRDEENAARSAADNKYTRMNDERIKIGLPSFQDGIPSDIAMTHQKLLGIYTKR